MNTFIDRNEELKNLCGRLSGLEMIGVDTESDSMYRYMGKLCLVQIFDGKDTWIVDPLKLDLSGDFAGVLQSGSILKIFHGADFDVRMLVSATGRGSINHIFDTYIAARLCGEPSVGLDSLVEKYFGVKLEKSLQTEDWGRRPVRPEMLEYAALDTRYLCGLKEIMAKRLSELGRTLWAEEEFTHILHEAGDGMKPEHSDWRSVKGAGRLEPASRAVLSRLHAERDRRARSKNIPPGMVLSGSVIVDIAEKMPADKRALETAGFKMWIYEKWGEQIFSAVKWARSLPAAEIEKYRMDKKAPPPPEVKARAKRLSAAKDAVAGQLGLDGALICPKASCEKIAEYMPQDIDAMTKSSGLRKWQAGLVIEGFLKVY